MDWSFAELCLFLIKIVCQSAGKEVIQHIALPAIVNFWDERVILS